MTDRLPLYKSLPIIAALAVIAWAAVIGAVLLLTGCDPCNLSDLADGGDQSRARCEASR